MKNINAAPLPNLRSEEPSHLTSLAWEATYETRVDDFDAWKIHPAGDYGVRHIATVYTDLCGSRKESFEVAALMAAAPELLAAARRIVEGSTDLEDMAALRAAVRKAEGPHRGNGAPKGFCNGDDGCGVCSGGC